MDLCLSRHHSAAALSANIPSIRTTGIDNTTITIRSIIDIFNSASTIIGPIVAGRCALAVGRSHTDAGPRRAILCDLLGELREHSGRTATEGDGRRGPAFAFVRRHIVLLLLENHILASKCYSCFEKYYYFQFNERLNFLSNTSHLLCDLLSPPDASLQSNSWPRVPPVPSPLFSRFPPMWSRRSSSFLWCHLPVLVAAAVSVVVPVLSRMAARMERVQPVLGLAVANHPHQHQHHQHLHQPQHHRPHPRRASA